jgi:hypothetical protein
MILLIIDRAQKANMKQKMLKEKEEISTWQLKSEFDTQEKAGEK